MKPHNHIWLYAAIIMLSLSNILHQCTPDAHATEPPDVEGAMLHIVTRGIPKHKIKPNAGSPILLDPAWRAELAAAIAAAGWAHGVPVWFLVAVAYREGSFRRKPVGKIGETSTFQITPRTARKFKCDMTTTMGQADCSARILRHWWDRCGTLGGGFMRYATGRMICYPDTMRLRWMHWDRLGITKILRERAETDRATN